MQKMPNQNKINSYEDFSWEGQMQEMQKESAQQTSEKEIIK